MTLVGDRPMVESREHLEQPDGQPKKLITREAREMRREFVRRGNPIDTCGRSCGSLSISRTWEYCGSSTVGEVRKDVAQGRTPAESWEGHSWYELRLGGYFIPNRYFIVNYHMNELLGISSELIKMLVTKEP